MEQRLEEKAVNLGEYLVSKLRRIERLGIVREIRGRVFFAVLKWSQTATPRNLFRLTGNSERR